MHSQHPAELRRHVGILSEGEPRKLDGFIEAADGTKKMAEKVVEERGVGIHTPSVAQTILALDPPRLAVKQAPRAIGVAEFGREFECPIGSASRGHHRLEPLAARNLIQHHRRTECQSDLRGLKVGRLRGDTLDVLIGLQAVTGKGALQKVR